MALDISFPQTIFEGINSVFQGAFPFRIDNTLVLCGPVQKKVIWVILCNTAARS